MYLYLVGWVRSRGRPLVHPWPSSLIRGLKPQVLVPLAWLLLQVNASAQATDGGAEVTTGMQKGLGIIMIFGFVAGCVMVMAGFLTAKRDENWKMTVIYGLGVAGAIAIMKALFTFFGAGGAAINPSW